MLVKEPEGLFDAEKEPEPVDERVNVAVGGADAVVGIVNVGVESRDKDDDTVGELDSDANDADAHDALDDTDGEAEREN